MRSSARVSTSFPARAGQPSALSASRMPSPAQTIRHKMSARPDRRVEAAPGVNLRAGEVGPWGRSAAAAGHWRCIPGHGHARRELAAFPGPAEPFPGIELAPGQQPARKQSAGRGFREIHRSDRTSSGRWARELRPVTCDRAFAQQPRLPLRRYVSLPWLRVVEGLPHRRNCRTEENLLGSLLGARRS